MLTCVWIGCPKLTGDCGVTIACHQPPASFQDDDYDDENDDDDDYDVDDADEGGDRGVTIVCKCRPLNFTSSSDGNYMLSMVREGYGIQNR